jgi:hypothetical protein
VLDQLKVRQKCAWIKLQVKQLSENKQDVLVEDMDQADDTHGSRYEALETQVKLKSYRFLGDRDAFGVVITSVVLSATVHLIVLGYIGGRSIFGDAQAPVNNSCHCAIAVVANAQSSRRIRSSPAALAGRRAEAVRRKRMKSQSKWSVLLS